MSWGGGLKGVARQEDTVGKVKFKESVSSGARVD